MWISLFGNGHVAPLHGFSAVSIAGRGTSPILNERPRHQNRLGASHSYVIGVFRCEQPLTVCVSNGE